MSDWKQIQARIRRAKNSADPAAQLEKLFEKTRDAMVAFELAKKLEDAGRAEDAARWYATAGQRFRRADWKKKAEEGAARLSGTVAAVGESVGLVDSPELAPAAPATDAAPEPAPVFAEPAAEERPPREAAPQGARAPGGEAAGGRKRRRRGRRGGRRRHNGKEGQDKPAEGVTPVVETRTETHRIENHREARAAAAVAPSRPPERVSTETAEATGPGLRGRSGDPGLASRLALLEMQMRRLLACPPVGIDQADRAPAGPGVFLVTDSDLITYYYVEACKTLRIGIANLLRGGSSRRDGESVKARFADHLGIPESRVGKYVSEHCVVRWLQLDENAPGFAHFAIAVLRPLLNE